MARDLTNGTTTFTAPQKTGPLTKANYSAKVLEFTRAHPKSFIFPVLDSRDKADRAAMEAWYAFTKSVLGAKSWRARQIRDRLDGRDGDTRWTFPTRFPSGLTGETNDDFRATGGVAPVVLQAHKDADHEPLAAWVNYWDHYGVIDEWKSNYIKCAIKHRHGYTQAVQRRWPSEVTGDPADDVLPPTVRRNRTEPESRPSLLEAYREGLRETAAAAADQPRDIKWAPAVKDEGEVAEMMRRGLGVNRPGDGANQGRSA